MSSPVLKCGINNQVSISKISPSFLSQNQVSISKMSTQNISFLPQPRCLLNVRFSTPKCHLMADPLKPPNWAATYFFFVCVKLHVFNFTLYLKWILKQFSYFLYSVQFLKIKNYLGKKNPSLKVLQYSYQIWLSHILLCQ